MLLLVNTFSMFRALYHGHFSHDFHAQGVTLKSKALATKCLFQIYSQLLDICTRLVLKTTEELYVPSVCLVVADHFVLQNVLVSVCMISKVELALMQLCRHICWLNQV